MNKYRPLIFIILIFMLFSTHAFGSDTRTVVIYYSYSGNTRALAENIADISGADIFEIKTLKTYPSDFRDCFVIAKHEQDRNFRPALEAYPDLSKYDMIYLGYPVWWSDMPMALYTFLENISLAGKVVAPFCTHDGSGIMDTDSAIERLCPDAKINPGFSSRGCLKYDKYTLDSLTQWIHKNTFY